MIWGLRSLWSCRGSTCNLGWPFILWQVVTSWGYRGIFITYKGYVEAGMSISNLPYSNEEVLLLLIPDNKYRERVTVSIRTLVIDQLVSLITVKELHQAGKTWKHVHLSTVLSKQNTLTRFSMPEYDLDKVRGKVQTNMKVVNPPFETVILKGQVKLNMYSKHINILMEPTLGYSQHIAMVQT